jgi:hypothetical protein
VKFIYSTTGIPVFIPALIPLATFRLLLFDFLRSRVLQQFETLFFPFYPSLLLSPGGEIHCIGVELLFSLSFFIM